MERELIERLRDDYENWSLGSKGPDILREAADLIESLRAQLDEARKLAFEEAAQVAENTPKYVAPEKIAAAILQRGERG